MIKLYSSLAKRLGVVSERGVILTDKRCTACPTTSTYYCRCFYGFRCNIDDSATVVLGLRTALAARPVLLVKYPFIQPLNILSRITYKPPNANCHYCEHPANIPLSGGLIYIPSEVQQEKPHILISGNTISRSLGLSPFSNISALAYRTP